METKFDLSEERFNLLLRIVSEVDNQSGRFLDLTSSGKEDFSKLYGLITAYYNLKDSVKVEPPKTKGK